jgi:hypothetical protein
MLMATQTVTVNAAFLQEIKEDNVQLRHLLADANALVTASPPSPATTRHLASLLAELRDQLAMHFSLEEAYGYFEHPVSVAPHLSEQAEFLRRQHSELYEGICQLAATAETLSSSNSKSRGLQQVVREVREFYGRLQDHEAKEIDLIAQAYNVDIGVGD